MRESLKTFFEKLTKVESETGIAARISPLKLTMPSDETKVSPMLTSCTLILNISNRKLY